MCFQNKLKVCGMVLKNTVIVLIISLQQCHHWLESINTYHPDISREIDPIISRK